MLSSAEIERLLEPYTDELSPPLIGELSTFLDLLLRWNGRTNLTAIRDPELLVQRQIGESLFAAKWVAAGSSLLDFGSGAGFPGIPLLLTVPELRVTLAESQGKKAAFLKEALRVLERDAEVWSARVETMPLDRRYDFVTMRAVDKSEAMLPLACERVDSGGSLLLYMSAADHEPPTGWKLDEVSGLPQSSGRLARYRRP